MEPAPPRIHAKQHAVQFYGNEQSLFVTVAGFLSEGLVAGQPAIIIATEPHRRAIVEHLAARLIDVEQAQRIGDLVLLDAEESLATFMVGDTPDRDSFESHVGGVIERVLAGRSQTVIRAYGEMVDLLWKDGRPEAAIRLEVLWNSLAMKYGFALLCGYSMGNFYKQAEQFREVCALHTHVIDPEPHVVPFEPKRPARSA
jgi:hypothetical protein